MGDVYKFPGNKITPNRDSSSESGFRNEDEVALSALRHLRDGAPKDGEEMRAYRSAQMARRREEAEALLHQSAQEAPQQLAPVFELRPRE